MKLSKPELVALTLIMTLTPGLLILAYSRTYISEGIGAVSFYWAHWGTREEVRLNVSSASPKATRTVHGQRLFVHSFNTSDQVVSIEVTSELNGSILDLYMVSGQQVQGVTFPSGAATGWVLDQDFNITIRWEGVNATVSFRFEMESIGHADGTVVYIAPGFYEVQAVGLNTLMGGFVLFVICATVLEVRARRRR